MDGASAFVFLLIPSFRRPASPALLLSVLAGLFLLGCGEAKESRDSSSPTAAPLIVDEPGETPEGMIWIPGGSFEMGTWDGQPDEAPAHEVSLDGFWMDTHEVTNRRFKEFVDATGYVTLAEKFGNSVCFVEPDRQAVDSVLQLWEIREGANWKHPDGPGSSIAERLDHPVVHVAWEDVKAFCRWAKRSLPTEAEFEYASRGGFKGAIYPWGVELRPQGVCEMNCWQGEFPYENRVEDQHVGTAPVGSYSSNGFGLFDVSGNVWEWCSDYYHPTAYASHRRRNPKGPDQSFDPAEPDAIKRVIRGGSYLCNENYCTGYRVTARMKTAEDTGLCHTGFRTVLRPTKSP